MNIKLCKYKLKNGMVLFHTQHGSVHYIETQTYRIASFRSKEIVEAVLPLLDGAADEAKARLIIDKYRQDRRQSQAKAKAI